MSRKETHHTGTFTATDADGEEHVIHIFTDYISSGSSVVQGLKSLETDDGQPVNRIDKGRYEILMVFGKVEVTSDDPKAP